MNLLENELIRKYFHDEGVDDQYGYKILDAMQEKIKNGERYLVTHGIDKWEEAYCTGASIDESFHPCQLRLPSQFQPQADKKASKGFCCEYMKGNWRHDTTDGKVVEICIDCLERERKKGVK